MATEKIFTKDTLVDFRNELRIARNKQSDEERLDYYRNTLLSFMGVVLSPTKTIIVACLSIFPNYMSDLHSRLDNAIDLVTYYHEYLWDHSDRYDLIKLKINVTTGSYNGKIVTAPTDLDIVAVHCINPPGWDMA